MAETVYKVKLTEENTYQVKRAAETTDVRILMLKGEKGETGDPGPTDFDLITNTPKYANAPMTSETNIPDVAVVEQNLSTAISNLSHVVDTKANLSDLAVVATTNNYTDLDNLPFVPSTAQDVHALPDDTFIPTKTSDLANDSGFITSAPVNSVNGQTGDVVLNIPVKTSDLANDSGFITAAAIPTKTSDLANDSGFITNVVNDLTNYYLKSETYTQTEVNNLIGQISTVSIQVVQTLPQTGDPNVIYFVPKSVPNPDDIYNEFIYVNNTWELIGNTQVDLSNYYTKTETDTLLNNYTPTSNLAAVATSGAYNDLTGRPADNIVLQLGVDAGTGNMIWSGADTIAEIRTAYEAGGDIKITAPIMTDEIYNVTECWWENSNHTKLWIQSVDNGAALIQIGIQDDKSVELDSVNLQKELTAGANISISGTTISASVPTVPTATSQLANDGSDGTSTYVEADQLGLVATSNNYNDLDNLPTIPTPITVDSEIDYASTNPVQNKALYQAIVGKEITFAVPASAWSEPSGTNPYKTIAIITLPTGSFTDNCTIELMIGDKYNDFAKYGFVLYSAETVSQRIWLTAMDKPTSQIYLTVKVYTYGD